MKGIKFRAWSEQSHKMLSNAECLKNMYNCDDNFLFVGMITDRDWGEPILMQYTGLNDKNGVDIYEGDVVRATSREGDCDLAMFEILYDDIYGSYVGEFINFSGLGVNGKDNYPLGELRFDIEVIGNIYENNELL